MKRITHYLSWFTPVLFLLSACAIDPAGKETGAPMRAQGVLGVQKVLVLAVSFPGKAPDGNIDRIKQQVLQETLEYYNKASYGKTTLVGEMKGWYQLPRPLEDYKVSPYNIQVDPVRVRRLVEDAFSAAEKEVNFSRYKNVILVLGVTTKPGEGYGMIAYCANPGMLRAGLMRRGGAHLETVRTRGGQEFNSGIVVVAHNARVGHVVHDLAHALGGAEGGKRLVPDLYDTVLQGKVGPLTHESYPKFAVFMGSWDVMSQHFITRDGPAAGMSSFTRLRLGWIEDQQVVEISPGESRAVTLAPLGDGRGTLVLRIPGRWGSYYLLENRQIAPSDPVLPSEGLIVLAVDEAKEDGDGIVKVENANPKVPAFGAAAFGVGPGQTPSVRLARDVAVEVLWREGKNLTVMVTKDSQAAAIQSVAKRIRETEDRLQGRDSPRARQDLTAAKTLLLQMKIGEAKARVEGIR